MKRLLEISFIFFSVAIRSTYSSRENNKQNKIPIYVGVILPLIEGVHEFIQTPLTKDVHTELTSLPASLKQKYVVKYVPSFLTPVEYPVRLLSVDCDQMVKQKVVAIVYLTTWEIYGESTASVQYFMHLNSYTGIPIIAWNADNPGLLVNRDLNKYRTLQMAPTLTHQANAVVQIIKRYEWKKFIVVTTYISGYDRFIETCRKVAENNSIIMARYFQLNLKNVTELNEQLEEFTTAESRVFALYSSYQEAKLIFREAEKHDLLGSKFMWIATQSVTVDNKTNPSVPVNFPIGMMAVSYKTQSVDFERKKNVLFQYLKNALKVFKRGLDAYLQDRNYTGDFASNANCDNDTNFTWAEGEEFYRYLKNVHIEDGSTNDEDYPSYPISFDEDGFVKDAYLSIYNLKLERKWEKVGEYRDGKVIIKDITWPGGMMKAPNGVPEKYQLKIVTLDEPPFVIVNEIDPITNKCLDKQGVKCIWDTKSKNGTTEEKCCSGFCVDLLERLALVMQFNFSLYKVPDGLWGAKTNNRWNGLVAELVDGSADMCVTALKINSEREKDIDFSVPFLETGITIAVAIRGGALSPTAFLEPFEFNTWIFILLVSILAAAIAIFLFEWLSPESFDRKTTPPPGHKFSFFRAYWLVWATLFSASVNTDVPRSHTARFMALVWAAFSLTFLAIYTANLAAFMITRTNYHRLSGINDAKIQHPYIISPSFLYGTVKDGNTETTLRLNYPKLHSYMQQKDLFKMNVSDGIKAVKTEEYHAFIYDSVVLDYLVGKDDQCVITTVGKWFSMTGYGIGLPKKSKWLKQINKHLLSFQEDGYLERYKNFWFTGACSPKKTDKGNQSSRLGVENFVSAFVLLAGGTLICLFLVCVEYLYCNYFRQRMGACNKSGWCGLISLSMGRSLTFKEAVERVHTDYKKEKKKSTNFTSQREKLLEHQLSAACAEITRLKKEDDAFEHGTKELPNRYSNFGYLCQALGNRASIKCSEIETVI